STTREPAKRMSTRSLKPVALRLSFDALSKCVTTVPLPPIFPDNNEQRRFPFGEGHEWSALAPCGRGGRRFPQPAASFPGRPTNRQERRLHLHLRRQVPQRLARQRPDRA